MPADLVRRITTPVTVTELLKLTRYLERRVQLLVTEEASNRKQTAIVEYGSKLHDFADKVLQLSAEEQALSTAVIDGGKNVQSMDKLFATRVQTNSEIESREGISLKQKQAAKLNVEKAGKAVTDAKRALAKATKRRDDSIGQHLTGDTRLGFTSYNDLVAELNMITATPDDSKKIVRFSGWRDEAEDRSMHALRARELRTSELKDIIKQRADDLYASILGIGSVDKLDRYTPLRDKILFILAGAKLTNEFAEHLNSSLPIFAYISARVKAQVTRASNSPADLLQVLWDSADKQDGDSTLMQLQGEIANSSQVCVQERFAHIADCVALVQKFKEAAPVRQWAEPPGDSIAPEALRVLMNRMNDGDEAKGKLHAFGYFKDADMTLASANGLCANVDKALNLDAKRKAADDGGSPSAKRTSSFNLLNSPSDPKNVFCGLCNGPNHVAAGCLLNLQTSTGGPNLASGTWDAARFALVNQSQQAAPPAAAQPQQAGTHPAADGGRNSSGGVHSGWQRNSPGSGKGTRWGYRGGKGRGKGKGGQAPTCYNCNQLGHRSPDCRLPKVSKPFHTCWTCGEQGHRAPECPSGAAAQFLAGQPQPAQGQAAPSEAPQAQLRSPVRPPQICQKCGCVGHQQAQCNANW
jgi:hypothetical protein